MKTEMFEKNELDAMIEADNLKISPFRSDGKTYGTPTWIWAVEVDGEIYVRAYNGIHSRWYQSAISQRAGQIHAAGMVKDVIFEHVPTELQSRIDEAYRTKYNGSSYLAPMIGSLAKDATLKIIPVKI